MLRKVGEDSFGCCEKMVNFDCGCVLCRGQCCGRFGEMIVATVGINMIWFIYR